jgi:hypothetical protein
MEADPMLNRRQLLTTLLAGFAGQSLITARATATQRDSDPRGSDFSAVELPMQRFIEEHQIAGA